MYRIVQMSGKYYGIELPSDAEEAIKEITDFVRDGTPVVIVQELSELEELDIYDDVILVERD